ncbi:MAG: peptidyl-prolyl cis-trans isomerase [Dethiobacteria bacterium]
MFKNKKKNTMVYVFTINFLLILFSIGIFAGCDREPQQSQSVQASVNNEVIKKEDVEEFINLIYLFKTDTGKTCYRGEYTAELREEALWLLIKNALISQEVRKLGLPVDEEEIERHYQLYRKESISGLFESEEIFLERLKELGLTEHSLKKISRNAYLTGLLFEYICADVTEEDARDFVEENPLFMRRPAQVYVYRILLDNEHDARYVHSLLSEGADFIEVGGRYSLDSALELGLINANDLLDPLFLQTAFNLEPGEISDPVEISGKFHIIKITAKDEASMLSFEEVKEDALEIKKREHFERYYLTLMEDAVIKTF